jgi:hypothetical protein
VERQTNRSTGRSCGGSNGFLDAVLDWDPAKEWLDEFKSSFSKGESMIDKTFLSALVQDDINVTGEISHVILILSDASIKFQGHQIEMLLIQGKAPHPGQAHYKSTHHWDKQGDYTCHWRSKGCGVNRGVQHW